MKKQNTPAVILAVAALILTPASYLAGQHAGVKKGALAAGELAKSECEIRNSMASLSGNMTMPCDVVWAAVKAR